MSTPMSHDRANWLRVAEERDKLQADLAALRADLDKALEDSARLLAACDPYLPILPPAVALALTPLRAAIDSARKAAT